MSKILFKTKEFHIQEEKDCYVIVPFRKTIKAVYDRKDENEIIHFQELIIDKEGEND